MYWWCTSGVLVVYWWCTGGVLVGYFQPSSTTYRSFEMICSFCSGRVLYSSWFSVCFQFNFVCPSKKVDLRSHAAATRNLNHKNHHHDHRQTCGGGKRFQRQPHRLRLPKFTTPSTSVVSTSAPSLQKSSRLPTTRGYIRGR